MDETDNPDKREGVSKEFSKVADATNNFLKAIFPHCYSLVERLKRGKLKKVNGGEVKELQE